MNQIGQCRGKRVFFKKEETRILFFKKLRARFGTLKKLRDELGIYKSRLERFMNGTLSMPCETFSLFLDSLNEKEKIFFSKSVVFKEQNWGRVKGGLSTYKKHKEIFEIGRRLAKKKTKYKFDRSLPLSEEVCEFIGAFIGDGFTNNYGGVYVVQITGDSRLDKSYFENKLSSFIKHMSPDSKPKISIADHTIRLTLNSKELHLLLVNRFGFPKGNKTYTVAIPAEILNSNLKFLNACIRGIFDTDGCVTFDRRKAYSSPYIRIILSTKSERLMTQIHEFLIKQGINSNLTRKERLQINGLVNCQKFIKTIGFSNARHLEKLNDLNAL